MTSRCRWTDSEDMTLVNVLLEEKKAGNQSDNGWKKSVWVKAQARLAEEHAGVSIAKTAAKCLEHYGNLKKKYRLLQRLKNLSGFGWDNERKMAMATDAVWETCIKATPSFKWFKTHPFPLYDSMSELVDGTVATGAGAFHAGQQQDADVLATQSINEIPAIRPESPTSLPGSPAVSLTTPSQSRIESEKRLGSRSQPLREKTNTMKSSNYDDELSLELSDSEQASHKPSSRKRERASTESPEPSSSGRKSARRGKRNAEATVEVADAIRDLSRSMALPENPVSKVLKLIHNDGDFSDSDDEASVLALFTIKPEIATAVLESRKQSARTTMIKKMLLKENL